MGRAYEFERVSFPAVHSISVDVIVGECIRILNGEQMFQLRRVVIALKDHIS